MQKIFLSIILAGCVSFLGACSTFFGVDASRLDTANKNLAAVTIQIESLADLATTLVETGTLSPEQARPIAKILRGALDGVKEAQSAIAANGDPSQADSALASAKMSISIALQLLTAFNPAATDAAFSERTLIWISYRPQWRRKSPAF